MIFKPTPEEVELIEWATDREMENAKRAGLRERPMGERGDPRANKLVGLTGEIAVGLLVLGMSLERLWRHYRDKPRGRDRGFDFECRLGRLEVKTRSSPSSPLLVPFHDAHKARDLYVLVRGVFRKPGRWIVAGWLTHQSFYDLRRMDQGLQAYSVHAAALRPIEELVEAINPAPTQKALIPE